jgi:hypothetical protein
MRFTNRALMVKCKSSLYVDHFLKAVIGKTQGCGQSKARSRAKKTLPDPRPPFFLRPSFDRVRSRLPLFSVRGFVVIVCAAAEDRSDDL